MNTKLISAVALAAVLTTGLTVADEASAAQYRVVKEHVDGDRGKHRETRHQQDRRGDIHINKRVRVEKHVYRDRHRHDRGLHRGHKRGDRFERYYRYHQGRDYYRPRHKQHSRWQHKRHHHHGDKYQQRHIERTEHHHYDDGRPRIRFSIDYHTAM